MINKLFALAIALIILGTETKMILNQQVTIRALQSAVADRDYALDITADAINIQQGWLDNRKRHIDELGSALSACMSQLPKKK